MKKVTKKLCIYLYLDFFLNNEIWGDKLWAYYDHPVSYFQLETYIYNGRRMPELLTTANK